LTARRPQTSTGGDPALAPELQDPGRARERTALAWTRSALNMAASGTLIARAAFAARLDVLGVAGAIAMATLAWLTWRHGREIYYGRELSGAVTHPQTRALGLLTAATLLIALVAVVVTIAI
jgi:uncharacterized membrane protein YidH (DUF202 family)